MLEVGEIVPWAGRLPGMRLNQIGPLSTETGVNPKQYEVRPLNKKQIKLVQISASVNYSTS